MTDSDNTRVMAATSIGSLDFLPMLLNTQPAVSPPNDCLSIDDALTWFHSQVPTTISLPEQGSDAHYLKFIMDTCTTPVGIHVIPSLMKSYDALRDASTLCSLSKYEIPATEGIERPHRPVDIETTYTSVR